MDVKNLKGKALHDYFANKKATTARVMKRAHMTEAELRTEEEQAHLDAEKFVELDSGDKQDEVGCTILKPDFSDPRTTRGFIIKAIRNLTNKGMTVTIEGDNGFSGCCSVWQGAEPLGYQASLLDDFKVTTCQGHLVTFTRRNGELEVSGYAEGSRAVAMGFA